MNNYDFDFTKIEYTLYIEKNTTEENREELHKTIHGNKI